MATNNGSVTALLREWKGLTSLMRVEAFLTASKNGVSQVYLKLPLFFSKEDLYSLCRHESKACYWERAENATLHSATEEQYLRNNSETV